MRSWRISDKRFENVKYLENRDRCHISAVKCTRHLAAGDDGKRLRQKAERGNGEKVTSPLLSIIFARSLVVYFLLSSHYASWQVAYVHIDTLVTIPTGDRNISLALEIFNRVLSALALINTRFCDRIHANVSATAEQPAEY